MDAPGAHASAHMSFRFRLPAVRNERACSGAAGRPAPPGVSDATSVPQRNVRFGRELHVHVGDSKGFDGAAIFAREGKHVMTARFTVW